MGELLACWLKRDSRWRWGRVAWRRRLSRLAIRSCFARRLRVALIARPTFAFPCPQPVVPATRSLFHQTVELLALFRRQQSLNLLPRIRHLFASLRLETGAQFPKTPLAIGDDFINPLALLGSEAQLASEQLNKFPVEDSGAGRGGICGAGDAGQSRIMRW